MTLSGNTKVMKHDHEPGKSGANQGSIGITFVIGTLENGASTNLTTWTPKVCKIMAFIAVIMGLRLLFYILWGFRHFLCHEASFTTNPVQSPAEFAEHEFHERGTLVRGSLGNE